MKGQACFVLAQFQATAHQGIRSLKQLATLYLQQKREFHAYVQLAFSFIQSKTPSLGTCTTHTGAGARNLPTPAQGFIPYSLP